MIGVHETTGRAEVTPNAVVSPAARVSDLTHVGVPAHQCYWVWVGAGTLDSSSTAELWNALDAYSSELDAAIRRSIPVPLESLHLAMAVVAGSGEAAGIAVCLVDRSIVAEAQLRGALTLTPESLPELLDTRLSGSSVTPEAFNLLTGEFEPPTVRRLRWRTAAAAGLTIGLALGVAFTALGRKAEIWERRTADLLAAATQVHDRCAPAGTGAAHRRCELELRRLRAAAAEAASHRPTQDAASVLSDILSRWPAEANASGLYLTTQSLQVGPGGVTMSITLPSSADAEPLLAAMRSVPGWTLQQTQRSAGGGSGADAKVRMSLRLIKSQATVKSEGPSQSPVPTPTVPRAENAS